MKNDNIVSILERVDENLSEVESSNWDSDIGDNKKSEVVNQMKCKRLQLPLSGMT